MSSSRVKELRGILIAVGFLLTPTQRAEGSDAMLILEDHDGVATPRAHSNKLADWFSRSCDLIVLGEIRSCVRDSAKHHLGAVSFGEGLMTLRIERILRGYSPDSVVSFRQDTQLATRVIQPGTQILALITRRPDLPQGAHGSFYVVDSRGALLTDRQAASNADLLRRDSRRLRLRDLPERPIRNRDIRAILRGATAVAAVRFSETRWSTSSVPWRCDSARWVFGSTDRFPTYVRFAQTYCGGYPPGDEYLIPVPQNYRGDTLFFDTCPRSLRVSAGEVTAFGVSLAELPKVLTNGTRGGVRVVEPSWTQQTQR